MKNFFISLGLLLMCNQVFAGIMSAYRDENVDYTVYEQRVLRLLSKEKRLWQTPLGSARAFHKEGLPDVIEWRSAADMQERFEKARDLRFMETSRHPNFQRRISWMYPIDGCYSRAALFSRNFFRQFVPIPDKIFAFGNLRVKTPNHVRGYASWWYHVASIVEVDGEKYVMDPAVEPLKPLTLNEWLTRMGKPEKIKISVCKSGSTYPGADCGDETDGMELWAERDQKYFLDLEWNLLRKLGRNPELELGEHPPW